MQLIDKYPVIMLLGMAIHVLQKNWSFSIESIRFLKEIRIRYGFLMMTSPARKIQDIHWGFLFKIGAVSNFQLTGVT